LQNLAPKIREIIERIRGVANLPVFFIPSTKQRTDGLTLREVKPTDHLSSLYSADYKAMKMVSAAKLRRAQEQDHRKMRPYSSRSLTQILNNGYLSFGRAADIV